MNDDHRREEDVYIHRFLLLSDKVERALRRAAFVAFALLLAAQALLLADGARERLTGIDRLEGRSIDFAPPT
ncbi:hypothetical protein MO973_08450 [Paenibacillus sp. TRM 82003]|nr:hypothetical protein [Paenibacillus sp. TRM 82003]